jgi:hypothetical protein
MITSLTNTEPFTTGEPDESQLNNPDPMWLGSGGSLAVSGLLK